MILLKTTVNKDDFHRHTELAGAYGRLCTVTSPGLLMNNGFAFCREERHLHSGQVQLHLSCNKEQLQGFVEPVHGSFSREMLGSPRVLKFRESGAAPCRGNGSACFESEADA